MMDTIFDKAYVMTVGDIVRFMAAGAILGLTAGLLIASTLKL